MVRVIFTRRIGMLAEKENGAQEVSRKGRRLLEYAKAVGLIGR